MYLIAKLNGFAYFGRLMSSKLFNSGPHRMCTLYQINNRLDKTNKCHLTFQKY